MHRRLTAALFAGTLLAGTVALVASARSTAPSAHAAKKYTIYLSNNFVGNDWRQQMERVAKVSIKKGPLAGRVDLKIENVENTVQAQINSLNNIIQQRPDAILVDAGSPTALNPTLKRACKLGIVVISFDQIVTSPCAYKVESDWNAIPRVQAAWMAVQLNGKGKVFIDLGLAGAPISARSRTATRRPEEVSGHRSHRQLQREYALGPEQAGVARCSPRIRKSTAS